MTSSAGAYCWLRQPGAESGCPEIPSDAGERTATSRCRSKTLRWRKRGGSNADDAAVGVSHR
jgi:hypothetical protein